MGYTHYFTQKRDYTKVEWAQVLEDIGLILKYVENEQGIAIRGGDGTSKPTLDADVINFNGAGDDSHENFIVERKRERCEWDAPGAPLGRSFCKTARKPYDIAVTACLCYLTSVCETHVASSDGDGSDFLAGLELARQALPRYANMLDIPRSILEDDRWCGPWASVYAKLYDFRFCIDGRAYILGPKGKTYRFYSHLEAAQWAASHIEKPITVNGMLGRRIEGGTGLFQSSGSYDENRSKALARQQTAVMRYMIENATGDRLIPPPAIARPNELAAMDDSPRAYSIESLLKMDKAA